MAASLRYLFGIALLLALAGYLGGLVKADVQPMLMPSFVHKPWLVKRLDGLKDEELRRRCWGIVNRFLRPGAAGLYP